MTAAHGCCRIMARIEQQIAEAKGFVVDASDEEIYKGVRATC